VKALDYNFSELAAYVDSVRIQHARTAFAQYRLIVPKA
jgi:hypothetical protein